MAISPQKSLKALIYRSRNNGKVKTVVGAVPMAQTGRTLQRKFAEWPYAELSSVFWGMAKAKPAVQLGKVRGHPEEANSLRVYWSSTSWNQIGYQAHPCEGFLRTGTIEVFRKSTSHKARRLLYRSDQTIADLHSALQ